MRTSEIFNVANILSLVRLLLIPPIIYFIFADRVFVLKSVAIFIGIILYSIGCLTDYYDGYLARKYKLQTSFGIFFDPLSDKIFNISIMISFLYVQNIRIYKWFIICIIAREVLITFLRIVAIYRNREMQTESHGKIKTAVQIVSQSIVFAVMLHNAVIFDMDSFKRFLHKATPYVEVQAGVFRNFLIHHVSYPQWLWNVIMMLPNVFLFISFYYTISSGIKYVYNNRKILIR